MHECGSKNSRVYNSRCILNTAGLSKSDVFTPFSSSLQNRGGETSQSPGQLLWLNSLYLKITRMKENLYRHAPVVSVLKTCTFLSKVITFSSILYSSFHLFRIHSLTTRSSSRGRPGCSAWTPGTWLWPSPTMTGLSSIRSMRFVQVTLLRTHEHWMGFKAWVCRCLARSKNSSTSPSAATGATATRWRWSCCCSAATRCSCGWWPRCYSARRSASGCSSSRSSSRSPRSQ